MNARTERVDILRRNSLINAKNSHYDLAVKQLQNNSTIIYTVVTVILAHCILSYLGIFPFSIPQALWNLVVYLTPSRIVVALDAKSTNLESTEAPLPPMTFQAKSEAMQRILGIDTNSFSSFFPRARGLSGFGNALLGTKDNTPPGLGNWDNSCYQNSVIQGLASLRSLADFLQRNLESLTERGSFSTHQALKDIIESLNGASNYGQKLWIPPDLKSMSSWQQQDAQEYFSKVVDQVDREIQQASRGQTKNFGLKIAGPEEHIIGAPSVSKTIDEHTPPAPIIESPSLRNPLEGLLAQRVGCMRCGWTEGLSLIPFNCLTVPLGGNWEYDIRECLDQYMNLEPIEGVECAKCTLLRTREQLRQLLSQIEEDQELSKTPESPNLSDALKSSAESRLQAVEEALEEDDFAEKTLSKKCHIPSKNRVSSTKSRQAVIARTPKCLVIHINRSLFDENSGMLRKNYADVRFPKTLDLNDWCLGTKLSGRSDEITEKWGTNPKESMLPEPGTAVDVHGRHYELRAVITHYGRHENGHYICYRKYPTETFPAHVPDAVLEADGEKERPERWYRLSDDDVQMVSERNVMSQGGVFMLFYETVDTPLNHTKPEALRLADVGNSEATSTFETPEDMSMTSMTDALTQDGSESTTSKSASISPPDRVVPPIDDFESSFSTLKPADIIEGSHQDTVDGVEAPSVITAA